jgi:MGT family glycosyltransferase
VLFVVPPLTGHVNPTVALGQELATRGHDVAWVEFAAAIGPLLPAGARVIDTTAPATPWLEQARRRPPDVRGAAAFRFLWQDLLIPLTRAMVPAVEAAIAEFQPDVLVVDQQAMAGGIVARRHGLPWATSATTSAELIDPFTLMPKLGTWVTTRLHELQRDLGVSADTIKEAGDLRFSEHLVLAFTTEALIGSLDRFPDHYVFVGPATRRRAQAEPFPWQWLDPSRRTVLVSLGTVNHDMGQRFYPTVIEAARPLAHRLQVIVAAPPDLIGPLPAHMLAVQAVPQLDLLPHLDAVVCHAGHNTVCESLAHGVPLVVAPIRDDQPIIAGQVVDAGAGTRVKFGRVGAQELRDALLGVLDDPTYRQAARQVQASFAAAGGTRVAADHVEKLP